MRPVKYQFILVRFVDCPGRLLLRQRLAAEKHFYTVESFCNVLEPFDSSEPDLLLRGLRHGAALVGEAVLPAGLTAGHGRYCPEYR